jgi:hypothetical protein
LHENLILGLIITSAWRRAFRPEVSFIEDDKRIELDKHHAGLLDTSILALGTPMDRSPSSLLVNTRAALSLSRHQEKLNVFGTGEVINISDPGRSLSLRLSRLYEWIPS